jgi:hypothetical protein
MTLLNRATLALTCGALLGMSAATGFAADQTRKVEVIASEALAGKISLPASTTGALVMSPCAGCAAKSYRATATTAYYFTKAPVTLQQFQSAIGSQPSLILTVAYDRETGDLISVTAPIPAALAAKPQAKR